MLDLQKSIYSKFVVLLKETSSEETNPDVSVIKTIFFRMKNKQEIESCILHLTIGYWYPQN